MGRGFLKKAPPHSPPQKLWCGLKDCLRYQNSTLHRVKFFVMRRRYSLYVLYFFRPRKTMSLNIATSIKSMIQGIRDKIA